MGEKALIFGSMSCGTWSFLEPYRNWPDHVLAADGGLMLAREAGFRPTAYIGDGDSGGSPEPALKCITLPVEKDVTDLEAACLWAVQQGCRELLLTGCSGGRLDHYLSALGLLEQFARRGVRAVLLDDRNRAECLLPGTHILPDRGYRYFSLIPLDRELEGVTITGAKYELQNRTVPRGGSLTVSNEFSGGPITISFQAGCCDLIYSR